MLTYYAPSFTRNRISVLCNRTDSYRRRSSLQSSPVHLTGMSPGSFQYATLQHLFQFWVALYTSLYIDRFRGGLGGHLSVCAGFHEYSFVSGSPRSNNYSRPNLSGQTESKVCLPRNIIGEINYAAPHSRLSKLVKSTPQSQA
jgi:hypothetical protein